MNLIPAYVYLLLIIFINHAYSARPLTPYQRSFTPARNISCAQCEMKLEVDKSKTFVETDMYRRRCLDEPELFFKPCIVNDKNTPRGCAKLTTYLKEPVGKGRIKEVTLMKRFCATEGAEPEEIKCVDHPSEGGNSELCICGTDNCNSAPQLLKLSLSSPIFSLTISTIYMIFMKIN
ncbi:unnamed protein product [Schistosoma curassoni]|uniref:Protein quiver n=1 Tax=Schistosoma curassoni TaxID=6186 RepID=A0A183K713_9TREM|nr:unnamed protein product [Schistosoma curassoni]VDP41550.1 unnamed protein product [Schistosoma curassoni]